MNFNLSVNRAPCSSPGYLVTPESAGEVVQHVLSGGECLIEVLPFHGTGGMYPRRVEQMKRDSNGEWWFGVQLWCFQWFQFPSAGLRWTLIGRREIAGLREERRALLDADRPIATPAPSSTPAECSLPAEWTSRPYYVDPPSGHRYGFPKLYDPQADGDMTEWLIAEGYPEKLARQGLACTFSEYRTDNGEK